MGLQSLRDKLLQAGLVTQEQAEKAKSTRTPSNRAQPGRGDQPRGRGRGKGRSGPPSPAARGAGAPPSRALTEEERRAKEEEAAYRERERLLNQEREQNRRRAAEDRKRLEGLREIAASFEVEERGEEAFFFTTRKRKLQRIYLTAEQIERLNLGDLAIIDKPLPGELSYALVPREGAERALLLDPKALRFYNRGFGQTFGFQPEAPPDERAGAGFNAPTGAEEATSGPLATSAGQADEPPADAQEATPERAEEGAPTTAATEQEPPEAASAREAPPLTAAPQTPQPEATGAPTPAALEGGDPAGGAQPSPEEPGPSQPEAQPEER